MHNKWNLVQSPLIMFNTRVCTSHLIPIMHTVLQSLPIIRPCPVSCTIDRLFAQFRWPVLFVKTETTASVVNSLKPLCWMYFRSHEVDIQEFQTPKSNFVPLIVNGIGLYHLKGRDWPGGGGGIDDTEDWGVRKREAEILTENTYWGGVSA